MAVTDTQFFTPPTGPRGRRRQLVWRRQDHIFVVDVSEVVTIRAVRDEFLDAECRPASTLVRVAGLLLPELLIEVEAVACPTDGRVGAVPSSASGRFRWHEARRCSSGGLRPARDAPSPSSWPSLIEPAISLGVEQRSVAG